MNEWQMEELNFLRAMAKSMQGRIAELEARLATVAPVAAFQIDKKPCSEACETLGRSWRPWRRHRQCGTYRHAAGLPRPSHFDCA